MIKNEPSSQELQALLAAKRKHRKKILIVLLGIALVVFVLPTVSILLYATSDHAFTHYLIPMITKSTDGRVKIRSGDISLFGKIRLDGFHFDTADGLTQVDAEELYANTSLTSLRGVFHIKQIKIDKVHVVTHVPEAAKPVEQPGPNPLPVSTPPPLPRPTPADTRIPSIPVRIDQFDIVDSSIKVLQGEETRASFDKINMSLTGLAPGNQAKAKFSAEFAIAPDDKELRRTGVFHLDLGFTQMSGAQPKAINWEGRSNLVLNEAPELHNAQPGDKMTLSINTWGSVPRTDAAKLTVTGDAKVGTTPGGSLALDLDWDAKAKKLESKIDLKDISTLVPNLLLAAGGEARMESGTVNGSVVIHTAAGGYEFDSNLTGADLSVRQGKGEATPPIQIKTAQKGVYAQDGKQLELATIELGVTKKDKKLVTASLDKPVTLNLDRKTQASTASTAPDKTNLTIELAEVDLSDIRAWMKAVGSTALDQLEKGSVNGKVAVEVEGAGDKLSVNGKVNAEGLVMKAEGESERRGPFTFENEIHGSLEKMDKLTIEKGTGVRLTLSGRELAKVGLSGTQVVGSGAMDLVGEVGVTDLGRTVDAFVPRTPDQKIRVEGGKFKADLGVKRADSGAELAVKLASTADDFELRGAGGKTIKRNIAATGDVNMMTSPTSSVDFRNFKIEVSEGKNSAGTIEAKGKVGLKPAAAGPGAKAPEAPDGHAEITIAGLEAAPWINVMGWFSDREFKSVPIEGKLTLVSEKGGERLGIDGEEKIGPIKMASGEKAAENVTLTIQNNLERLAQDVMNFTVTLAAADTAELIKADMKGTMKGAGARPELKANVKMSDFGRATGVMGVNSSANAVFVKGGTFDTTLETKGEVGGDFRVTGKMAVKGATLTSRDAGKSLKPGLEADYDVVLNQDAGLATINKIDASIDGTGSSTGKVTTKGMWPFGAPTEPGRKGKPGKMTIGVHALDLKPWGDLFGWGGGMEADKLPLDADVTAGTSEDGKTIIIEGDQKIGPTLVQLPGGEQDTITAALKNHIEKTGDQLKAFTMELTSNRSKGAPDKLTMKASGTVGDRPKIKADLDISSLGADFYLSPFMSPTEVQPAADEKADAKPTKASAQKSEPTPAAPAAGPLKDFPADVEASIKVGRVTWREISMVNTAARVDMTAKKLNAQIEKLGLNGGNLAGTVKLANADGEQRVTYKVEGSGVDIGPVLNSVSPSIKGKVVGKAALSADGEGIMSGGRIKDTLNGKVLFDLTDGQLNGVPVLDYIADVTKVDAFRKAVFTTFHGETNIASGVVDLKDVWLQGTVVQIKAGGKLGIGGDYDVKVKPGLGVQQLDKFTNSPYLGIMKTVLGGSGNYVDFPLWVTVKGHGEGRQYGVQPDSPEVLKSVKNIGENLGKDLLKGDLGNAGKNLLGGVTGQNRGDSAPMAADGSTSPTQSPAPLNSKEALKELGGSLKSIGGGLLGGGSKKEKKEKKKK